ncbi:hypothetical protein HOE22_08360 [Candidatus Woesearchaeota archaeon]|nr:hypothetical protein [Candidatus Woesearchaeota archaeon]MBT4733260.1 hypothetical protein [Candidatus Woesearchaeota archaeon]
MTIREIVSKLENIEIELGKKGIDSECEMVAELVDTIIADDLEFSGKPSMVNESKVLDALVKMGIESGTIGQA